MSSRTIKQLCLGAVILLAVAIPLVSGVFYTRLATQIAIYGMVALSVDLLVGYAGLVTLGHAALFGVGAYVTGILSTHGFTSAFVIWPVAVAAATACALLTGALALRTSGFQFIMVTLAFAQMVYYFWLSLRSLGGENGFAIERRNALFGSLDTENHVVFYYVALTSLGVATYLAWRLVNSQFGMVVQGVRENEQRLAAIGFPPLRYKLVLYCISGALAGFAGALMTNHTSHVSTEMMSWQQSGNFLAMVILGTPGTLFGALLGAGIFVCFQQFVSSLTPHWMFYFGLLIVFRILLLKGDIWTLVRAGRVTAADAATHTERAPPSRFRRAIARNARVGS